VGALLPNTFYTAASAAAEVGVDADLLAQAFKAAIDSDRRLPVAHYTDETIPALRGSDIMPLIRRIRESEKR